MHGVLATTFPESALLPVVEGHLARVVRAFEAEVESRHAPVLKLCRHVERYRGKMLRPTLAIVSGLAVGGQRAVGARHEVIGAVLEMIHMATLVHDDLLDEAEVRRGGATVNAAYGDEAAILLGDYLFSSSFHLCASLGDASLCVTLGSVASDLCAGELLQQEARERVDLREEELTEILRLKTGVLIGAAAELGAREAGGNASVVEALRIFGTRLGIAFQEQDDILDLMGDEERVGKSVGRDLAKGKLTMPVVLARATLSGRDRDQLDAAIRAHDGCAVREAVVRSGGLLRAQQRAEASVDDARAELAALPASDARDLLDAMALAVVRRER